MLLLGLFDQSPPEILAGADYDNQSPAYGPPVAFPAAEASSMTTDPVGRLEGSHKPDFGGIEQISEESSAVTTLKRKRTPNIQDNTSMLPISSSTSRTRPDLPHFMGFDNQLYRCICETTIEPDAGTSIQCESCLAWQHAGCFGLHELELEGNSYFCQMCSEENEIHQPDLTYVEYIQRLALSKEALSIEPSIFPEAVLREGKRPRLASATGRGGKSRVRHSGPGPKSAEPEGSDRKPMSPSGDAVPVVAPRSQRKKQVVPPRIAKSKVVQQAGVANIDVPQSATVDHAGSHQVLDDLDCPLRFLEYIPIARNLATTREVEGLLRRSWTDQGTSRIPHNSKLASTDPTEAASPELHIRIPAHQPQCDSGESTSNPNVFVKLAEKAETSDVSVYTAAGQASPDISSKRSLYELDCYGVYARRSLDINAFLGEFRGEVYPASEYERDPANQYAILGLPKAFVKKVGPPLGLVVDARRYGTDMRFARSSCHPNACLSVMTVKSQSDNGEVATTTSFGIFATRDIPIGEEITLPWDWDANHVVHQAQKCDQNSTFHSRRLDAIGQHLARALTACACASIQGCTLATLARASQRGCGSAHRSADDTVSVAGVGRSRYHRQGRSWVDPVTCEDSASIWGTFGREGSADCLHDDSMPALRADYQLDTWLSSESYTCNSDNDDDSLRSSRDLSFDTDLPGSLLKGYTTSPILPATRPSTLLERAKTRSYPELLSASGSVLNDDEDSMSMSATSTLTEPLSDDPDHEDYAGFAGTIENGSLHALPHEAVSLASPERSPSRSGAPKGPPRIIPNDHVDSPASPFPPDIHLAETGGPAAVYTSDQVERTPDRQMSFGDMPQVSDAVSTLQLQPEPDDNVAQHETETQEDTRDPSLLSKKRMKRIDLANFMQETDTRSVTVEHMPAVAAETQRPSEAADIKPKRQSSSSPTRAGVAGSLCTDHSDNIAAPWWKSAMVSSTVTAPASPIPILERVNTNPLEGVTDLDYQNVSSNVYRVRHIHTADRHKPSFFSAGGSAIISGHAEPAKRW